jgi:hypothetical protein
VRVEEKRIVRTCLLAAVVTLSFVAQPADFFVATDGLDTQSGSQAAPFATLMRAQSAASPGDTIHIRGGTYTLTDAQIAKTERIWAYVIDLNKSGREGAPIRYAAYQNERPVFDFSRVKPAGLRITAFHVGGSWLEFKGLEVTGVQVTLTTHTQSICFDNQGSHNLYENLSMHDGQAIGFWLGRGSHNRVLNCDAYRNHDYTSEDHKGGNVDGFGFHAPTGSEGNIFRGCRAWLNSDDGFDFLGAGASVTVENCWAIYNGYDPDFKSLGDGNGFKAGGYGPRKAEQLPSPIPRHVVSHCLAVRNKAGGFYANHHPGGIDWIHNTAYRNGSNFNMLCRLADNVTDVPGYGHVLKNNLAYGSRADVSKLNADACEIGANSFTLNIPLSERDFASLDESELVLPRQPNGELPRMSALHLLPHSAAIDKGLDVGAPFAGKAPDLGAFEFTPAADTK